MRKILILFSILLSATILFGQNSKVVSAYNYLKEAKILKAKEAIDKATVHPKTVEKAKTWWYNGLVYHAISDSCMFRQSQKYCEIAENAADIAFDSYIKALVLNFKDPKWHTLDIMNKEADAKAFGTLLSDKKTKYVNSQIIADVFMQRFPMLANVYVNKGIVEYQSKDSTISQKAFDSFERSLMLSSFSGKTDVPIIYYAGLAAKKNHDYETAIEYLDNAIKYNYGEAKYSGFDKTKTQIFTIDKACMLYWEYSGKMFRIQLCKQDDQTKAETVVKVLAQSQNNNGEELLKDSVFIEDIGDFYLQIEINGGKFEVEIPRANETEKASIYLLKAECYKNMKDTVSYLEELNKGIAAYPENSENLVTGLINYYLTTGKAKEALDYLKIAVKNNPTNHTYYHAMGTMHENLKDSESAIEAYTKSIELKSDFFDSQLNLGAVYYNQAVEKYKAANDIPPSKQKEYDAIVADAKELLKLAKPYLEAAHQLKSDDRETLLSLKEIYYRLQEMDKFKEVKEKIDSL